MKKITLTNSFHNTESSFIPQATTSNPLVGTVSKAVQSRVRRELCGSPECQCQKTIESFGGDGWDVVGIDYYGALSIKFYS